MHVIMGVSIGTVCALCVGLLLHLLYKYPEQARKLVTSFMRTGRWIKTLLFF